MIMRGVGRHPLVETSAPANRLSMAAGSDIRRSPAARQTSPVVPGGGVKRRSTVPSALPGSTATGNSRSPAGVCARTANPVPFFTPAIFSSLAGEISTS